MTAIEPLSLTRSGPFYALLRRLRLVRPDGGVRWYWFIAITWLPMAADGLVRWLAGLRLDGLLLDPSVHVRFLIAVPLVLLAENLLERRCRGSARCLYQESLAERESLDSILAQAVKLRDARVVEALLAGIALLGGQAALWGIAPPSGWLYGLDLESARSFGAVWYATFALPLAQFLILRWLWHWLIWTYVLVRLSRLTLATNALHPDGAAGLVILSGPTDAFVVFVAAITTVASAAWTTQLHAYDLSLQAFVPAFVAFVLVAIVVACGPLLLFSPQIYLARRRDLPAYHAVAQAFVREFRRKWILERDSADVASDVLEVPDFSALNDLDGSYEVASRTRALPFGMRPIVGLWVGAAVPMIPLVLSTMPLSELARALARMLHLPVLG